MNDPRKIINTQYNHYSSLRKMIFDHVPVDFVDGMFTMLDAVVNTSRQVGYQHAMNLLQNNNPNWGGVMPVKYPEFTLEDDLMVDYNLSKMATNANDEFKKEVSQNFVDKLMTTYDNKNNYFNEYRKDFVNKLDKDYATQVSEDRKRFVRNLEVGSEVYYTGDIDRGDPARVISIDTSREIDEATEVIVWLPTNVEVKTNVSFLDPLTQVFLDTRNEFMQRVRPGDRVYYCPEKGEEFYTTVKSVMDISGERTESTPVILVYPEGGNLYATMGDISHVD